MAAGEDPGARRNRDEGGLWLINLLVSVLVAVLSLYVFRAEDGRRDAGTTIAAASLPAPLTSTPAMAATGED